MPEVTIPGLTNGQLYGFRMFPRNMRDQFQTEIDMGTAEATPKAEVIISYYGKIDRLTRDISGNAASKVGTKALFAGGQYKYGSSYIESTVVDVYDEATKITSASLSKGSTSMLSSYNDSYALFGGGDTHPSGNSAYTTVVYAFNSSLTRTNPTALSTARGDGNGGQVGEYAIMAGGHTAWNVFNSVDAYDSSLTKSTPSSLTIARSNIGKANVGDYILFAGGESGSGTEYFEEVANIDAYDSSLTKITSASLWHAIQGVTGVETIDHALFAGGSNANDRYSNVYSYDSSLTRNAVTSLPKAMANAPGVGLGGKALFYAMGGTTGQAPTTYVIYTETLQMQTGTVSEIYYPYMGIFISTDNYAYFSCGSNSFDLYNYDVFVFKGI